MFFIGMGQALITPIGNLNIYKFCSSLFVPHVSNLAWSSSGTKWSKHNLKLGKIVVLLYPFDLGKFRPKNIVIL